MVPGTGFFRRYWESRLTSQFLMKTLQGHTMCRGPSQPGSPAFSLLHAWAGVSGPGSLTL